MSTFLLPLEPEGKGTLHVEAFGSYFSRLARVHCCSPTQLARLLSSHYTVQKCRKFALCESLLYAQSGAGLFGYRERVEAYVEVVEAATGCDWLRRCTLVPLRPALGNNCHDTVRATRAWCQQCFREDSTQDSGAFDRLLWTLKGIDRCPDHRVAFRETCPSCSIAQNFYHRSGDPGLCWKCGHSLIGHHSLLQAKLEPSLGERDLCELVAAISCGRITNVRPDVIQQFQDALNAIVSPVAGIVKGVARISGSARASGAAVKPGMGTLLRKAHAAGVSLLHLFEDPRGAALVAGQLIFDQNMIAARARIRHPKEIVQEIKNALRAHLKKPRTQQIPRLNEVADMCGVSVGYVRHHCSSLVKRYQHHRVSANIYQTIATTNRCIRVLRSIEFQQKTRHLRGNIKKLAFQLSVDAQCGVRMARWVVRTVPNS